MTALPSIFAVEDVCYQTIANLEPELWHEGEWPSLRRTLAQTARVCTSFRRPALKTLWKRLPEDRPLVDLLYTLGIATTEKIGGAVEGNDGTQNPEYREILVWSHPDGPLHNPSWKLFGEYASFVCGITLFPLHGPTWLGLWAEICPLIGDTPILPALSSLISPSVRELTLDIKLRVDLLSLAGNPDSENATAIGSLPISIAEEAPNIEKIKTVTYGYSRARHVTVDGVTAGSSDLQILAQLLALEGLDIALKMTSSVQLAITFSSLR
ncbi:hypothetical protein DICSQDRAFT_175475 [Dichomitus squalens LYAD-421 SS1]|uniref:Uncharacterized protein n=1 Tax=Dichomitus squalens (strain LYAD-421) TaxID=732165 RepID=R7SIX3_DICSQ|nr:uncharacterized protein DICSQDRAFT_175475 [Dichomitus squalens LYAD-421 SS1]EJF55813.1 hypothetical protein DICSQDRAFT_175475 [Dichomitus squalens LYAD-421 SS1]